jgi:hypothetical protein
MLLRDEGSGNYAREAAAARASVAEGFPGAAATAPGEVSAQYVVSGYWWPARRVPWSYNPAGKPASLGGDHAAIQAAAAAWAGAGANFAFEDRGTTRANTGACGGAGPDGANTLGWAPLQGTILGLTCAWFTGPGDPQGATEFDMQLDPEWRWTTGSAPEMDLQSVVTHEFGHALGLGHTPDTGAIMFATYQEQTLKHTPAADDVAGALRLYGPAPSTPPPAGGGQPALELRAGANLVAWPRDDLAPDRLVTDQPGVAAIYGYDPATGTWKRYGPGLPAYVNNLKVLQEGQAYWFMATAPLQLSLAP